MGNILTGPKGVYESIYCSHNSKKFNSLFCIQCQLQLSVKLRNIPLLIGELQYSAMGDSQHLIVNRATLSILQFLI